jgi:flagellar assembly factor FliW
MSGANLVTIDSQQLGPIEVPRDQLLEFPHGLFGFRPVRRFCLVKVSETSRFELLQSCERADLAFVVVDPLIVEAGYPIDKAMGLAIPPLEADEQMGVACIVTVPPPPDRMTVNLMAPLVIGVRSRRGVQVILHDDHSVRHEL